MKYKYQSFMDEIWNQFPGLSDKESTDLTDHNILWSLDEYMAAGYVNFTTGPKELYRLSILLENYAVKHRAPLLATFETEKRYKYVEGRYVEILKKVPKAWIIGNFNNPLLAPLPPQTTEVVSCDGTNISDMWIVVTRGPEGPFGLVAEDIGDRMYRGFFSISPIVTGKVIQTINEALRINIDLSK
ncbi:hypothetical protein [Nitrosopumilus sp.]|uniref:hypothetical protein n=1 Tax=Nitrosopumilus sp. TaxID=2024843 RepID=UPI003B59F721